MRDKLDMQLGPDHINNVQAQIRQDLYGRHTKVHTRFGQPRPFIRISTAEGRHRKSLPPWLDDFIVAAYEYAEQTSAENISRLSGGIVVPARRRGFELDTIVMDEADRLNDE